jgi:hypothetical protein
MKRLFSTIFLFAVLFATASAQYFIIDTLRLNKAYDELLRSPQSMEKQRGYFNAFPCNWAEFYDTYKYCSNKGYDLSMYRRANEHIQALEHCTAINDTLFCNRLIALSVGASLDADAPCYLNMLLHNTVEKKSDVFMYCLSEIEKGHQMQFWQFYWSNIIDGNTKADATEFKALYAKYKRKYPQMMKRMAVAFENFSGGVLFISEFYDFMKDKE